jgi:ADP-heptose:LPS heptosyltransferase
MAKSDWLNHVTNTYKMLKQANPEAKLKDAMKAASKSFKKVSSTVRSFVPMNGRRTKRHFKGHKKGRKFRRTGRSRRYRGGNDEELLEQQE